MKKSFIKILSLVFVLILLISAVSCSFVKIGSPTETPTKETPTQAPTDDAKEEPTDPKPEPEPELPPENPALTQPTFTMPEYNGQIRVEINGGVPTFTKNQLATVGYEHYSALDPLGRCGLTVACIGKEIMPTESRGSTSSVTPTGWHSQQVYERSHLIGWQLSGENANKQNLITGTFMLNGEMQKFEDMVAAYVKETNNHVMYRVTPIFEGNNLLASGVWMEAYSVEDNGEGISYNVFIFNVQNDYDIDYATGNATVSPDAEVNNAKYVINKNNGKFHKAECSNVAAMNESNKIYSNEDRDELAKTYTPAGCCKP